MGNSYVDPILLFQVMQKEGNNAPKPRAIAWKFKVFQENQKPFIEKERKVYTSIINYCWLYRFSSETGWGAASWRGVLWVTLLDVLHTSTAVLVSSSVYKGMACCSIVS